MSNYAQKVKRYYDNGFWTISMVANAVVKGKITAAEFEEITGIPYEEYNT